MTIMLKLSTIALYLLFTSFIIGYIFCHGFIGPILLKIRNKRNFMENYIYPGNILHMEHDLKKLASENDKAAINTLRIITVCKWIIIINLSLFIIFYMSFAMHFI